MGNSRLKIGIVTAWYECGAGMVSKAYRDILSKDADVFIYARGGHYYETKNPAWNYPGVTWGKKVFSNKPLDIDLNHFFKWVSKNKIDIVFFNEQQSWDVVISCKNRGIVIGSYIDYYTTETVPFFDMFDFLICNTKRHFSVFKNHSCCIYLPWGTNTELFSPSKRKLLKDEVVFFHSAGLTKKRSRKGTDLAILAFESLNNPFAKLIIHSQSPLVNYDKELQKIIRKNENIKFITKTVSSPGLYYMGDVYVYPTRLEGIGLTIAEALSCGLPTIITNDGPMNEFVMHKKNGYLVDVAFQNVRADNYYWKESTVDLNSLKEAYLYYIKNRKNLLKLSEVTRSLALERLNWEKNASGIYKKIYSIYMDKKTDSFVDEKLVHQIISYQDKKWPRKSKLTILFENYKAHKLKGYTHFQIFKRYLEALFF